MKKCDKDEKQIIVREGIREGIQEYSKLPMRARPMVIYIAKEYGGTSIYQGYTFEHS